MSAAASGETENFLIDEDPGLGLVLSQDAAFLPSVRKACAVRPKGQLWGEQEQRLQLSTSNWNAD